MNSSLTTHVVFFGPPATRSMLRSLFKSATGNQQLSLKLPPAVPLRYQLYRNRWHLDSREPISFVWLHDVLGSAAAMSPLATTVTKIPVSGLSPLLPLDIYIPDLRGHGLSPSGDLTLLSNAADVDEFVKTVVEFKESVHLVGFGHGARVALACALAFPEKYTSVVAVDAALDAQRTAHICSAMKLLPSPESTTLKTMNEAMRRVVPSDSERIALMLNYNQSADGAAPASWRSTLWMNGLSTSDKIDAFHTWPSSELRDSQFSRKAVLVKHKQSVPPVLPEGIAPHQFPSVQYTTLDSSVSNDELLRTVLAQLELLGPVEDVSSLASAC